MDRTITGAAVAAALALTGLSAHAGCADPRTAPQQGAMPPLSPIGVCSIRLPLSVITG
jgi:hypothetical protein